MADRKGPSAGAIVFLAIAIAGFMLVAGGIAAVLAYRHGGREVVKQLTAPPEDNVIRTSLSEIGTDIEGNRPAALNRYKGREFEVQIVGVLIRSGDEKGVWLVLVEPGGTDSLKKSGLMWKAWFSFRDARNAPLKEIRGSGPINAAKFTGRVRGTFQDIENANILDPRDMAWVILNPAHVEPDPTP